MTNRTIPFEIPNVNHGLVEVKGLLHFKKEELVLEFDERDAIVGIIKSSLKERSIPFSELESISFKKKFFSNVVEISGRSMKSLQDIPGSQQGSCKLKIKRKNRDEAERVVSSIRVALSEFKLREMEE
ncbi:MAG: hypothetical protein WEA56_07825 [Balneolaceae bacterium]